jgi:hypothetical protein
MSMQDFKSCEWHDTATQTRDGLEELPPFSRELFYKSNAPNPNLPLNKQSNIAKTRSKTEGKKIKVGENYIPFWVISFTTPAATVVPMSLTAKRPSSGNA